MKTKPTRELGLTSRISNAVPPTENLGSLTPVHLDDVIKNRNLDYLESLGELVERTPANPIWYQYQSTQNKMKFLQVYQLSINYAQNTFTIYNGVLAELNDEFSKKKTKVDKLKAQILNHKEKTSKLKRQFNKQKLLKERQKVLSYEKNLKIVRDNMKKHKKELEAQNEERMKQIQELKRKQKQKKFAETDSRIENPFAYLQQPPPPYYQYYPYPPPPPYYPQTYTHPHQEYNQPPPKHREPHNKTEESFPLKRSQSSKETFNPGKFLGGSTGGDLKKSQNQLKQSKKSKEESVNSAKTWTLRNTNPLMQSNAESEKQDKVEELNERKSLLEKRISIGNSKLSRKSSDLEDADIGSFMDIQLKTVSKNDVELRHNLQLKRTTSIQFQRKKKNQYKLPAVDEVVQSPAARQVDDQKNKQVESIKKYDNNMSVKITNEKPSSTISDASVQSSYSKGYGYLEHSNQGHKGTLSESLFKGVKGIRLKESGNIGRSIANSLQDVQSRNGSKLMLDDEQVYRDDFQTSGDLEGVALTQKTRVKVNVQFSQSSPEKQKNFQFAPLYKNYFILKDDALNMQKSKDKSETAKSMKEFSIKFAGAEKRKIENKSQLGLEQNSSGDFLEIDMPMNSIIAKPSKLKMSTIVRKSAIEKINKSHDPKLPGTFIAQSPRPAKQVRFADKTDTMDDNFANIAQFENLKSIKINKNNNLPPVPPRPQEKLASLQMAQSHIIEEIEEANQEEKSDCSRMGDDEEKSLELSVIEESENQSLFTQQNSTKQKVLLLIDKKYKQKGAAEFDKEIIKNQIQELRKQRKTEALTWQEITNAFTQLSKKKKEEINLLKENRKFQGKTGKKKGSSRQSSEKILKNQEKLKSNISKIDEKKQEEDDLNYSRSMLENPNSDNLVLKRKQSSGMADIKKEPEDKGIVKTKYIREQKDTNNNRMLQKIIESSKFDQDDQLENVIKTNFRQKTQEKEKENDILDGLQDDF